MNSDEMFEIECSDEECYFDSETVYRQVNGKRVCQPRGDIIAELYNKIESNGGCLEADEFDWKNPGKISPSQLEQEDMKNDENTENKSTNDSEKVTENVKKTEFDFDNDFDDDQATFDTNTKVTVKNRTSQGMF